MKQDKARQKALNKYKDMLISIQRSINLINEIPLNEIIFIRTTIYTTLNKHEECDMLVEGKEFNRDSIRLKIHAQEKEDRQIKNIKQCGKIYPMAKTELAAIRFKDILEWKEWDIKDTPLIVGYCYVSNELKKIAFN